MGGLRFTNKLSKLNMNTNYFYDQSCQTHHYDRKVKPMEVFITKASEGHLILGGGVGERSHGTVFV